LIGAATAVVVTFLTNSLTCWEDASRFTTTTCYGSATRRVFFGVIVVELTFSTGPSAFAHLLGRHVGKEPVWLDDISLTTGN
jgi:hypothetical protein